MQGAGDQAIADPLAGQPGREQLGLDVSVITLGSVAQVVVTQALLEQGYDAGLGALFDLADCLLCSHWPVPALMSLKVISYLKKSMLGVAAKALRIRLSSSKAMMTPRTD